MSEAGENGRAFARFVPTSSPAQAGAGRLVRRRGRKRGDGRRARLGSAGTRWRRWRIPWATCSVRAVRSRRYRRRAVGLPVVPASDSRTSTRGCPPPWRICRTAARRVLLGAPRLDPDRGRRRARCSVSTVRNHLERGCADCARPWEATMRDLEAQLRRARVLDGPALAVDAGRCAALRSADRCSSRLRPWSSWRSRRRRLRSCDRVPATITARRWSRPRPDRRTRPPTPGAANRTHQVLAIGDSVMEGRKDRSRTTIPGIGVEPSLRQFLRRCGARPVPVGRRACRTHCVSVSDERAFTGRARRSHAWRGRSAVFSYGRVPRCGSRRQRAAAGAPSRWSNAHVIDWHEFANGTTTGSSADGFHLTTAGQNAYAVSSHRHSAGSRSPPRRHRAV